MSNYEDLSDQAILSGILIGGTKESQAISALYKKYDRILQQFIRLNEQTIDTSIVWETIESFVHGVKNGHFTLTDTGQIERILRELSRLLRNPNYQTEERIRAAYEDRLTWDYYLRLLNNVEGEDIGLITRTLGESIPVEELARRLIARGVDTSITDVKQRQHDLIEHLMSMI